MLIYLLLSGLLLIMLHANSLINMMVSEYLATEWKLTGLKIFGKLVKRWLKTSINTRHYWPSLIQSAGADSPVVSSRGAWITGGTAIELLTDILGLPICANAFLLVTHQNLVLDHHLSDPKTDPLLGTSPPENGVHHHPVLVQLPELLTNPKNLVNIRRKHTRLTACPAPPVFQRALLVLARRKQCECLRISMMNERLKEKYFKQHWMRALLCQSKTFDTPAQFRVILNNKSLWYQKGSPIRRIIQKPRRTQFRRKRSIKSVRNGGATSTPVHIEANAHHLLLSAKSLTRRKHWSTITLPKITYKKSMTKMYTRCWR